MSQFQRVDFNELRETIKNTLSVREVHQRYNGFVNVTGTMSECPFCRKQKLYETNHNTLKCYNAKSMDCGGNYDVFSYYRKNFGVGFFEALINLAKDFDYLSVDDAERILSKSYKGTSVTINQAALQRNKEVKELEESVQTQPIEVLNNVYETLARISPLKKNEYTYLKEKRDLPMDRIIKDYFSMPNMYKENGPKFMKELLEELNSNYNYSEETLVGVPGFYRGKDGKMTFIARRGIGMKARNAKGTVNSFQMRSYDFIDKFGNLTLEDETYKYLWGSSRKLQDGCGTNSAIDTLIPSGEMYTTLFITEGKFKCETICRRFKSPVIGLPGVNSWRNSLDSEITYVNDNIKEIRNIFVAFDGDVGTNLNVYRELTGMYDKVLSKHKADVKVVVWSQKYGKGLDDVILSNNEDKIKKVLYKDYIKEYKVFLEEIDSKYSIKTTNIFYKGTEKEVSKSELFEIYSQLVLKPLDVIL